MANEVAMAQDQSPAAINGQLIENTVTEQLLVDIGEMRRMNLTAKQKEKIEGIVEKIRLSFYELTMEYFGIDQNQTLRLSDQKLKALFMLISARAQKTYIYMLALGILIPVFGWGLILTNSRTIALVFSVRKLKKILGNSFDPVAIIRNQIQTRDR
ncbi:MAG: hypothetical protein HYT65_00195 [Candidatus Yanofskybacteria bacterium]|nr:hypothetical protein [Candidatus Yanofskybacteria bacterium]